MSSSVTSDVAAVVLTVDEATKRTVFEDLRLTNTESTDR